MANWEYHIDLKRIWKEFDNDEIDVISAGKKVAEVLRNFKMNADVDGHLLDLLDDVIFDFEHLTDDAEEFNLILQELYDWGDTSMPTPPGKMQRKLAWIATQF